MRTEAKNFGPVAAFTPQGGSANEVSVRARSADLLAIVMHF